MLTTLSLQFAPCSADDAAERLALRLLESVETTALRGWTSVEPTPVDADDDLLPF